jgi:protein involved in polysaccharide export with SLBB domain
MRSVEVRRAGRLLAEVDLYDYLIRGDASDDIRLEQGDRLFVPLVGSQVSIEGFVRRPEFYGIKPGERLRDLIDFAGGLRPEAYLRRLQIDRILLAAKQTPERERVILDVDLEKMWEGDDFELLDGDRVTVLGIGDHRDNQVMVEGHVEKPGVFELVPHTTLGDVISRAGDCYRTRSMSWHNAYVPGARLVRDGLPLGLDLEAALNGRGADLLLLPGDVLEVPQYDGTVRIIGAVGFESRIRWREGMTLSDYRDQAGGIVEQGDRNGTVVTYASQERQRSSKFLFFRSDPRIEPSSTISVPFKEQRVGGGLNVDQLLTRVLSFAKILVAIKAL